MTKPHEETWFVEADGPEVEVHRVGGSVCDLNGPHARTPDDLARAKLIAQAPAMARAMLNFISHDDATPPIMTDEERTEHADAMRAILLAAGVLESRHTP